MHCMPAQHMLNGMTVGAFFFPCFERHDDSRISALHQHMVEKQQFALKSSNRNASWESSFKSEEVLMQQQKSHHNDFAS